MKAGSIDDQCGSAAPTFKIAFLGDSSVGKTSIVQRFYQQTFDFAMDNTIGASFIQKEVNTQNGIVQLNIWDTAGQERYRSLVSAYTRGCNGAILTFSLDCKSSFDNLEMWIGELIKQCSKNCIIYVCGNKSDLAPEIENEEINEWVSKKGYKYFVTSAKTGSGVDEMFNSMAAELSKTVNIVSDVSLKPQLKKEEEKDGCC